MGPWPTFHFLLHKPFAATCGSSILAGSPSFAVSKCAHDLLALSLLVLVNNTLSVAQAWMVSFTILAISSLRCGVAI